MYIHTSYVYIYIYRERERGREIILSIAFGFPCPKVQRPDGPPGIVRYEYIAEQYVIVLRLCSSCLVAVQSVFKISCLFLRPRPWQFEI